MIVFLISLLIFNLSSTQCRGSQSSETNGIEVTPFYDTIILSDIADIINEFEKNGRPSTVSGSDSEIDENIEDLLLEYHDYLEKAHKQKQINVIQSKPKNKTPLSRYDKFTKTKMNAYKNESTKRSYFNPNIFTFSQAKYNNPLGVFIPRNLKPGHSTNLQFISEGKDFYNDMNLDKTIVTQNHILGLAPVHKSWGQIKSSCCCKTHQLPCTYNCKQCFTELKSFTENSLDSSKITTDNKLFLRNPVSPDTSFRAQRNDIVDKVNSITDNILNLRIKLDISMPGTLEYIGHNMLKNINENDEEISKEKPSNVNEPLLSYYNYPGPTDMFWYKKNNKMIKPDSVSLHKMTIQKKNKLKTNNGNKKHRKKLITFHNINLQPHQFFNTHHGNGDTHNTSNSNSTYVFPIAPYVTEKNEHIWITNNTNSTISMNNNHTHNENFSTFKITKSDHNSTEDGLKIENSIDNDYSTKINFSQPSDKLRLRRNISLQNVTSVLSINKNQTQVEKLSKNAKSKKKNDKMLLTDTMLLYWPKNNNNRTDVQTNNITAIILTRENKRAKLNISKETILRNHTQALEQAIFGEVDWNDMDTVIPIFISFIGKYITGALTFCSDIICHSMKCANKTCVHRVCKPAERLNNAGHCTGSNITDSVASMESLMDLPSNVAFEIVDILQNKLLGKIFGKMTLCITSKCISMTSYKKNFNKFKCTIKELHPTGHCPNIKIVKAA